MKFLKYLFGNTVPKIDPSLVQRLDVDFKRTYTPDMAELEQWDYQLFFSCDETLPGMHGHKLIADQQYLWVSYTQSPMTMLLEDLGKRSRPLIFDEYPFQFNLPATKPIRGRLYKVLPKTFLSLDSEKKNGVEFERRLTWVVVPYHKLFFKDVRNAKNIFGQEITTGVRKHKGVWRFRAWMYFAKNDYWNDLLNAYDYPEAMSFKNNEESVVKEFYDFKRNEEPPF